MKVFEIHGSKISYYCTILDHFICNIIYETKLSTVYLSICNFTKTCIATKQKWDRSHSSNTCHSMDEERESVLGITKHFCLKGKVVLYKYNFTSKIKANKKPSSLVPPSIFSNSSIFFTFSRVQTSQILPLHDGLQFATNACRQRVL